MSKIPFVNLQRQYEGMRDEIAAAIQQVLDSRNFIQGPHVEAFEREFAAYCGIGHVIGCSNGTAALTLALEACEVGPGDEVITTTHTFAATASAIVKAGAIPVFVDILDDDYNIDPDRIESALTERTRALLPVHLYGTPCNMRPLRQIADGRGLVLIEDAAQAHGAKCDGVAVGSFGHAATFSFYPGKNLGAYGDAGAIATNDPALAERLKKLRNHGRADKYLHDIIGSNQRMDGLQGAVLSAKLKHLTKWNLRRREIAQRYDEVLRPRGFKTTRPAQNVEGVYHLYIVEVSNRSDVQKRLAAAGIETGIHYPVPLHLQPAFRAFARDGDFPKAERATQRILSLPICGDLTNDEQDRVIEEFLGAAQA